MPADDLVLNVRQIGNYPPTGLSFPGDLVVIQRGGLGGPYQSITTQALVATALAQGGGPLDVSTGFAPADAVAPQIFTDNLVVALGATHNWNCYFSSVSNGFNYTTNGAAAAAGYDGNAGFSWSSAPPGAAGAVVSLGQLMQLRPNGQLVLFEGQINLPRDPMAPTEAATAGWVAANTVASFNGRTGVVELGTWDILFAGGAPIWSPDFGGCPSAPTPEPADVSQRIATTAFVNTAINEFLSGFLASEVFVSSFNGRTGAVVLTAADVTAVADAIYAPLDSPNFSGYATSITPPAGTINGQIATTAFVMNAVSEATAGVASFNGRTGIVILSLADVTAVGGAPLASPVFSGTPAAPTPAPGDVSTRIATTAFVDAATGGGSFAPINSPAFTGIPTGPTAAVGDDSNQLATTAFVLNEIAAVNAGVVSFNGRTGVITLLANDISAAGGATLSSPIFTGVPLAPTAAPGTNTPQIATCAFVMAAIGALPAVPLPSTTNPIVNGPATAGTSAAYSRGDHVHPIDTSRAAASALANYLPLAGGTLTGPIAGTSAQFSASLAASTMQINNGQLQITRGTATNPVVFFNDGSTNRTSLYFNIASGQSTWVDNFSGSNIIMGPGAAMTLSAGTIALSGNSSVSGTLSIQGLVLTTSAGYLYSTSGFTAPVLRFTGASGLLNPGSIPVVGDIANMAFAAAGGSPTGIAFQGTNAANTVAYFVWTDAGSDIRIKENIAPTQVDALAAILAIPVREFDYRQAALNAMRPVGGARLTGSDYHVPIGLVAQEVMGLIPDMDVIVTQPEGHNPALPNDLHAIVLPNAVPYLIRAIQQLETRLAALEAA